MKNLGFKDKNGVEVSVGDVVRGISEWDSIDISGKVIYNPEIAGFIIEGGFRNDVLGDYDSIEIITKGDAQ